MTNFLTLFLYWKVYKNRLESIEERKRFEHVGKISSKATEVGEQSKLVLVHFSFILNVSLSPVLSMSSIPPSDRS